MANEIAIIRTYFVKNKATGKTEVHHDFEKSQAPRSVNPNKCAGINIYPLTSANLYINDILWTSQLSEHFARSISENSELTTIFTVTT